MSDQKIYFKDSEILGTTKVEDMPADHQANYKELLVKISKVREAWGKSMRVTSGYRSKADQIRIYKELAAQRKQTFDESKIPWGSAHLKCAAIDISDPDGKLYDWTRENEAKLAEIGVWMEVKDDQARVHFQIYPPKSGNRWFKP
jgi:uncharacterized protein YcbK (DUF882 family)